MKLALNLLVGLLFCFESAIAQDDLREWTDVTGKHKMRAALVKVHEDKVELRLENGEVRTVLKDRLSKADVAYLSDLASQQENPAAPPAAKDQREKFITNSIGMKLVLIPKGTFMMGSPPGEENSRDDERQHEVTISRDYYLGQFEVTQAQYEKVMDMNPSNFKGARNPVDSVSWDDAVEFCKRLSELPEEMKAGRVYRLPTEAEWEYACRAGTKTAFSFGESSKSLGKYAWFNTGEQTHRVGQKKPNAWRLYDMHGNVWEWCSDWYGKYSKGAVTDPVGPGDGSRHVLRGGGRVDGAASCRSSSRRENPHYLRYVDGIAHSNADDIGFRVALSLPGVIEAVVAPQLPDQAAVALDSITNSIGMKLVLIPKGTFMMGAPADEDKEKKPGDWFPETMGDETQHEVTISQDYYLAIHEVTQAQYEQVMGANPSYFQGDKVAERHPKTGRLVKEMDTSNHPVEGVSWRDAVQFCARLSALPEEKAAGRVYGLPSEAEWEYACRAGSKTAYSFGHSVDELFDHAWYFKNSDDRTHPVGKTKPNAWGLYDMHGNVSEWCSDWYYEYPKGAITDPRGPIYPLISNSSNERFWSFRVIRGGSWKNADCRSAGRRSIINLRGGRIGVGAVEVGFRVALSSTGVVDAEIAPQLPAATKQVAVALEASITNSIGMKMVLIPQGTFQMGSPEDETGFLDGESLHEVTISQDYYLGAYEVTQAQYEQVIGMNPSEFKGPEHPVELVTWEDAVKFCERLSDLPEEKAAGRIYRLPTEAEWEYACRAGSKTAYSFGDNVDELVDHAWPFSFDDKNDRIHPVGKKKPNAWGLYDMYGNAAEWCSDWYALYPPGPVTDPEGPQGGELRIVRGVAWRGEELELHWGTCSGSSFRFGAIPATKGPGFRVAVSSAGIAK